ncbi:MAG: magnesium transporter CorA family protein [Anaerolineales bacterium]|nr:magnesium transporter CorA family protein [Anaerolineales bacterium]MCX7608647.1 magnesium transporter CorA family protein [Anaerolineales bacterium]MDW8228110.1 magnesium transporter CorA family protein [Anaerolineales bacterium]
MLKIYKTIAEEGLVEQEDFVNGCWIQAVDPTPDEVARLVEWGVLPELIHNSLDLDENARMERDEDEGYIFILLRVPYFQGYSSDVPYITIPIGIIIKANFVVTVSKFNHEIFRTICNGKYRLLRTAKRYRFVLYIFLETASRYLVYLRDINKMVDFLEDKLKQSTRNREVLELLKYQKSLTYFATALRSNEVMMERLQKSRLFNQYEEDQDLLEDVITENQQAIQMVNIATDLLAALMDAFASIISNNLNNIMKVLAAVTIIIGLPTIVASFYGMNVALPFQEHPLAFWFTVLISITFMATAAILFLKLDWF